MSIDPREQVLKVIGIILNLDCDCIPQSAKLNEFERWDSLNHMSIMLALEDELGIEFDDAEIANLTSVEELVQAVTRKTG